MKLIEDAGARMVGENDGNNGYEKNRVMTVSANDRQADTGARARRAGETEGSNDFEGKRAAKDSSNEKLEETGARGVGQTKENSSVERGSKRPIRKQLGHNNGDGLEENNIDEELDLLRKIVQDRASQHQVEALSQELMVSKTVVPPELAEVNPGKEAVVPEEPNLQRSLAQRTPGLIGAHAVRGINYVEDASEVSYTSDRRANNGAAEHASEAGYTNNGAAENLVVANPVQDIDVENPRDLPQAESLDADVDSEARKAAARIKELKTYALLAVISVIGLVVIFVAVFITRTQESDVEVNPDESGPTSSPSQATSQAPTSVEQYYLSLFPEETASVITEVTESPQSNAFQWLMKDVSFAVRSDDKIKQRFALATLYYATKGDTSWVAKNNWLSHSAEVCEWEIMADFGEKGTLSAHFEGFLSEMFPPTEPTPTTCGENGLIQHLWLDQNSLQGTVPAELYMLTSLKTLSLGSNRLVGSISSHIGQLSLLEGWSSNAQESTGTVPTEVGLLTNLKAFILLRNDFQGPLPTEIWQLTNLETISWGANRNLTGTIPSEIGALSRLRWLGLSGCAFSGKLEVPFCPSMMLPHVAMISIVSAGTLPSTIGQLQQLEFIELLRNRFSGMLPTEIGKLTRGTLLTARDNAFDGSLPTELGILTSMVMVNLAGNQFAGSFPSELGLLTNLKKVLDLKNNQFSGTIPTQLGLLTSLTGLRLHGNHLTGPIPSEFGLLTLLNELSLANNSLSGSVPQELLEIQPSLHSMSLEGNSLLAGTVPEDLCSINATCVPDFLGLCSPPGLSFDCSDLLCGCNCSCMDSRSM
jgi:Leucine-rich repeat (LRR) protein